MTTTTFKHLDENLSQFEKSLNAYGYFPLVSTASGVLRALYGTVESICGTVGCAFKAGQYFVTRNPEHRNEAAANYWYSVHGNMNVSRAGFEIVPVAGNLATLFYDGLVRLRANYTFEKLSRGVSPILESKAAQKEPRVIFQVVEGYEG